MRWEENIKELDKLNVYDYICNLTADENNPPSESIIQKLKTSSRYTPIFKLHEIFEDKDDPKKLSIMHINMQSFQNKHLILKKKLSKFERLPDIICISETHFRDKQNLTNFKLCNYSLHVNSRSIMQKGGVAMYVNNNFLVFTRDDLTFFTEQHFESLFLEIRTRSSDFRLVCGVIYRSPNGSCPKFCNQLETAVTKINNDRNVTACLCGDFNLDLSNIKEHKRYKNIMHQHKFFSCINRPTRFGKKLKKNKKPNEDENSNEENSNISCKLIDNIWCNKDKQFANSAILVDRFSDHLAVCCSLQTDQSHFAGMCEPSAIESQLQIFSDAFKTSQHWEELEKISLENKAPTIAVDYLSKLNTQKILDEILDKKINGQSVEKADLETFNNEVNIAIDKLKKKICDNLKKLFKNPEKIARDMFISLVKIWKEAADKIQVQSYPFRSSGIEIGPHEMSDEDLKELDELTGTLVEYSKAAKLSKLKISEADLLEYRDEAFREPFETRKISNATLNAKHSIAIPENIGDSCDPIQLVTSQVFFLKQAEYDNYISLFEYFGKCSLKNSMSLFAQNLIPTQVLKLLPIEVRKKLFSAFREIYLLSFKSVEMLVQEKQK